MNVDIEVTGCTNTCRHCSADGHPPYGDFFTLDELRTMKQEWGPLTIRHEPTAYSNFPEVYDESIATENGGWLVTNGFGLARRKDYDKVFEKMFEMGIHTISFTLHGLRKHHDWFVCREGAFDDILIATQHSKDFGFQPNWQIFVDKKGISDVPELVDMAVKECGSNPQIDVPYHRVGGRLLHYESIRPTLSDIYNWRIHELVDDTHRNGLAIPENLTAATWLKKWRENPNANDFKHPYEPNSWPPDLTQEMLTLRVQRDRKVFLDAMCLAPIFLGYLSEGKEIILDKISHLEPPQHVDINPASVKLSNEEKDQIHPSGFSVRYKAITSQQLLGR